MPHRSGRPAGRNPGRDPDAPRLIRARDYLLAVAALLVVVAVLTVDITNHFTGTWTLNLWRLPAYVAASTIIVATVIVDARRYVTGRQEMILAEIAGLREHFQDMTERTVPIGRPHLVAPGRVYVGTAAATSIADSSTGRRRRTRRRPPVTTGSGGHEFKGEAADAYELGRLIGIDEERHRRGQS